VFDFRKEKEIFSLFRNMQTGCRAYAASCCTVTGGFAPGVSGRGVNHSPASGAEGKN